MPARSFVVPIRPSAVALLALAVLLATTSAFAAELAVAVTDGQGRPLPEAVVAVAVRGARSVAAAGATAQMGQRDRDFAPRVVAVQAGTAVHFPNFDTVRHHVYSVSATKRFELKLYAGTPAAPVVFDKPGIAVLGCNIHDRMSGWVAVVDTPHFAITGADGAAVLDLPPGSHRLRVWHMGLGEEGSWVEQAVTVAATGGRVSVAVPGAARP